MNPQSVIGGQPNGLDAQAIALQAKMKESAEATQKIQQETAAKNKVLASNERSFYARVDGCFYVLKNGTICKFANGVYVTNKPSEIEELTELCTVPGQHLICAEPVDVRRSDAKVLKDVSDKPGSGGQVIIGTVSSAGLAGMLPN